MGMCSSAKKKKRHGDLTDKPTSDKSSKKGRRKTKDEPKEKKPEFDSKIEQYYKYNVIINPEKEGEGPRDKIMVRFMIKDAQKSKKYSIIFGISYDEHSTEFDKIGQTQEKSPTEEGKVNFETTFISDYIFEKQQYVQLTVQKGSNSIKINTTIGKLIGTPGQTLYLPIEQEGVSTINNAKKQAINRTTNPIDTVIMQATTVKNYEINVVLGFKVIFNAVDKNKDTTIFIVIKKRRTSPKSSDDSPRGSCNLPSNICNNDDKFIPIFKTEIKKITQKTPCEFDVVVIPSLFLCQGDFDCPFVFEFHNSTTGKIMRSFETTANKLMSSQDKFTMESTMDIFVKCELVKEPKFIDYLRGGTQISVTFGIDFTGSNLAPNNENSLHYLKKHGMNLYEKAIRACGDIVASYDSDQTFPVYGYGAVLPRSAFVNHCFPLSLGSDPNIKSIDKIMETYRSVIGRLYFSGPTRFTPVIRKFMSEIEANENKMYHILLILTDGVIEDMIDTKQAIVEASHLSASIIIVGIGNADFSEMVALDSDDLMLKDEMGGRAQRDIVQFVPFAKFSYDSKKLVEEVLKEVPRQLVEYYRSKNILPRDPIQNQIHDL